MFPRRMLILEHAFFTRLVMNLNPVAGIYLDARTAYPLGRTAMRVCAISLCLILTILTTACGHQSPLEPPWPPDPPVYREPPQVDQETLDHIIFVMNQPENILWYEYYDDDFLWGVLEAAYAQAMETGDDRLAKNAVCCMGTIGLTQFMPTLVSALDTCPFEACNALGHMQSDYAVYALIPYLDHEDSVVRSIAAWSLGHSPAYSQAPPARYFALQALQRSFSAEPEDWVREEISNSINAILGRIKV